ncbi:histamine N-methyltransferase-like [Asterias amurensis]|uniref:histamine N-methyltransferase-like n=1 Tax=Asterias amurensis TaxID=7602 RepID=UPI003AB5AD54
MDGQIEKFHPTLPLDSAYYSKCYQTLFKNLELKEPFEPWFSEVLGVAIRDKLLGSPVVMADLAKDRKLRHLGVGSGSGELEMQIFVPLLDKFKHIHNHVIEPSEKLISIYRNSLQTDQATAVGVEFDWHQESLEEHQARYSNQTLEPFHVITAVHSIYYGGCMEDKLPFLYNSLMNGGVMAFVVKSETDGLSKVQRQFLSPNIPGYRYYTKQWIQAFLESNNIPYETIDIARCFIDVTTCFDEHSTEGAELLDFMSHMRDFRKDGVKREQREEFMKLLRQNAHMVGEKLIVTHDTSAVIVQRGSQEFSSAVMSQA